MWESMRGREGNALEIGSYKTCCNYHPLWVGGVADLRFRRDQNILNSLPVALVLERACPVHPLAEVPLLYFSRKHCSPPMFTQNIRNFSFLS